jgi:glutamate racemase
VKLLVIACNTATAHAEEALREELDIPVVGVIEPGASAAVAATRTGRIGVLGTRAPSLRARTTWPSVVASGRPGGSMPSPARCSSPGGGGWTDHAVTRAVAAEYLRPLKRWTWTW